MVKPMDRLELKKLIKVLAKFRGRHTELVSLYIPAGYNMREIINMMITEQSEAQNIKSKQTRKNVISALEKIERRLKEDPRTPENGIALFSGNISQEEGKPQYELWEVVPPEPIKSRIYRCDKRFVLDPLREMVEERFVYGLISLDKNDAAIGYLKGKHLEVTHTLESEVPGKTTKGGQSQPRYERIREGLLDTFMSDIAEKAKSVFLNKIREGELLGIIIGGPGYVKDDFIDKGYLQEELKQKVIGRKNTNYAGESGLEELIYKSEDLLEETAVMKEKVLVNKFFENLKKGNGLSTYGLKEVVRALEMGAVETILLSEKFEMYRHKLKCKNCGFKKEEFSEKEKPENLKCECGSELEWESTPLIDLLKEKATQMNSSLEIISTETAEGNRFLQMGGIAAILRFRVE